MKKAIWIIIGIVLVGLGIFKLATNKKISENKVYHYDKESPITVTIDTVRLQSIDNSTTYTGTFEPNKETKISTDIQGKINNLLVDIGDVVTTGQILVQLDNALLKLQLQTIKVQIEGLEDDVTRYVILTEADAIQGIQLEKARLGLKTAKIQKETLLEQINKTTIRAPFKGIITAKFNEEGGFAAPGTPLLQVTDISTLRFTINVPESSLSQFQLNQTYEVSADAYPNTPLSGKVLMVGSKANIGNSFPIQFQIENTKESDIKSGMFGKVLLPSNLQEKSILIPSSAILKEMQQEQVYVVRNGKAVLQAITTSKTIGDKELVSAGLKEGDLIITHGFINLFENANVIIN